MYIRAAWLAPITRPPIRDGYVQVRDGAIVRVGSWDKDFGADSQANEVIDLGNCILTPGLVNPHTHLELTGYYGQLAPAPLWEWLGGLIKLRQAPGQVERERAFVADGAQRLLRAGVTLVGDISRRSIAFDVLRDQPIRSVNFVELLSLGMDPPRNLDELRAEVLRLKAARTWKTRLGISPHAPYTVPGEQIAGAIQLAHELGLPWTTHWAETREEVAFLAGAIDRMPPFMRRLMDGAIRSPRQEPIEFLFKCMPTEPPRFRDEFVGSIAHGNFIDAAEFKRFAELDLTLIYCPRAHRFFGHEPHPYLRMMEAGLRVAVGTDSMASNEGLSPLEELRFLRRETENAPTADVLMRMITQWAAAALGRPEQFDDGQRANWCGTLERGMLADLAAFPISPGAVDPLEALIQSAPPAQAVWVAGTRVL